MREADPPAAVPIAATGSPPPGPPSPRQAGFFLFRTPVLPAETARRLLADPDAGDGRLWSLAEDPLVRAALTVASPDLADALERGARGELNENRRQRLRSALLRYLLRMSTRSTPFGLFAAVSWGELGEGCTATIRGGLRRHTRADLGWLLDVVEAIESAEGVLPFLRLTANPLAHQVGDRLVLRPADVYGKDDLRGVSLRANDVVRHLLGEAGTGIPYADLVDRVVAAFPAPRNRVEALVGRLHQLHFLTTDLRPPLDRPRPECHVLEVLARVPPARAAYEALHQVSALMARCDEGMPLAAPLQELRAAQRRLHPEGAAFQVDAALSIPGCTVPAEVAAEVADAVSWLGRTMGSPPRLPHLTEYREAFTERYGPEGLVPLTELLSPEHGLGSPATYANPGGTPVFRTSNRPIPLRERAYALPLLAEALRTGQREIDVADPQFAGFVPERSDVEGRPPAPGLDVTVQIAAASAEAVVRGDWSAVLPASFAPAGSTSGRFVHLLPPSAEAHLREYLRAQDDTEPEVAHAELSYLPIQGRAANVTVHPIMRAYEIPVNVPPSVPADRVIPLGDIVIGLDGDRFAAYSARLGKRIGLHHGHLLNPLAAPDVCRLLLEIAYDGHAAPAGFDWGSAESAPFLPRVRRGRIVLRLAQWNIGTSTTFGSEALGNDTTLAGAVRAWRARWQVPRWVYLADHDRRLLLDLDHPLSIAELRTELRRAAQRGTVSVPVQEMYPGFDDCWVSGADGRRHLSEVVIPVITRLPPRPPAPAVVPAALEACRHRPRHLPGGTWLSMKLYTPAEAMDGIIRRLWFQPAVCPGEEWFYLRYADPAPHLRIRVRAGTGDPGALFAGWTAWARVLIGEGLATDLVIDTYVPELIRYGGPATMAAIERVFCANSAATARFLAEYKENDLPRPVVVGYALDTLSRQWGVSLDRRLARAASFPPPSKENDPPRPHRRLLADLLAPDTSLAVPRAALSGFFDSQATAVAEAAALVGAATGDGILTTAEQSILDALAHLQVNRLQGFDRDSELACHRLWCHALRTVRTRWPAQN